MKTSRYEKALGFIYNRQHFGIKLGLHNIKRLSEWLGNPQEKYKIVHVAGTNGKGSTSSFIAKILQAGGYKVGLFTSPHLADYRERIRVNGRKIEKEAVAAFIEKFRGFIVKSEVTFFEVTTALAYWYFARKKVDWVVLEVGLGGRLDATNIVTPRVSVITNISLEHTNLLGKTVYKIAGEKGGIIKPGVPMVTGIKDNGNPAARRLREICDERHSPAHFRPQNGFAYGRNSGYERLVVKSGPFAGLDVAVSLPGRHQVDNAFLAVRAVEVLRRQGVKITREAVKKGLASNYWPGRLMKIRNSPTVILDVAHNREGFLAITEALKKRHPGRKFHFLIGMVELKKGEECLKLAAPLAASLSVTRLETSRSDDPYSLIAGLDFGRDRVRVFPNASAALKDLLENCAKSDILIIAGSHFIMGELAPLIKRDGF